MIGKSYEGMNAVLYARVSTKDKDQDLNTQLLKLREWCKNNKVSIIGEYVDKESGADLEEHPRQQLDSMLGRIMRGGVNIILAWKDDRLSRDMNDKSWLLKAIKPYGTVIRYVVEETKPETSDGALIDSIGTWKAQRERSDISIRVKAGMDRVRVTGTKSGKPIGHPSAIINIDTIMQAADSGYSLNQTAKMLHVDRETIRRRLIREGRLEEFYKRADKYELFETSNGKKLHVYSERGCDKPNVRDNPVLLNIEGKKTGGD
jgi:DNA invertase Pin-like site-specific DNA recombinase